MSVLARRRPPAHQEVGAVAVIVALLTSTVLFGVAALTVDLGDALAHRTDVEGIADDAARAGANQLPAIPAATAAVMDNLCRPPQRGGWDYTQCGLGLMPGTVVTFTNDEGQVATAGNGRVATHITVEVPKVLVKFGFAAGLGAQDIRIGSTSTARVGTPTGLGVLPFFLVSADFARPGSPPGQPPVPGESGVSGQFCITIRVSGGVNPCNGVATPHPVPLPRGELRIVRNAQTSNLIDWNTKLGVQPRLRDWQSWPLAGSPRSTTVDQHDQCPDDVVDGVEAAANPFVADINCVEVLRSAGGTSDRDAFLNSSSAGQSRLAHTCRGGSTGTIHGGFSGADVTPLFTSPSPLVDPAVGTAEALRASIEAAPAPVTPPLHQGWINSAIFSCPRFGLVPVIDAPVGSPPSSAEAYPVLGFAYVWIDSDDDGDNHGFLWRGATRMIGLRGHILPPSYLPEWVTRSPTVGPYLGPEWPKQVVLSDGSP